MRNLVDQLLNPDHAAYMNALLVEDDVDLGETVKQILEENSFQVDWARTGPALPLISAPPPIDSESRPSA